MAALVVSLLAAAHLFVAASAFDNIASNRRVALQRVGLGILGGTAILPQPSHAVAADEELIDVYFGCGCFWHVQHVPEYVYLIVLSRFFKRKGSHRQQSFLRTSVF